MSDHEHVHEMVDVAETIYPKIRNINGKVSKIFEILITFAVYNEELNNFYLIQIINISYLITFYVV